MAVSLGKILMAYRPLYLRGLLMDGQYRLPVSEPKPAQGTKEKVSKEISAARMPASPRTWRGVRA
ncbi:hypothetical protein [Dyella sp. C11]|uniref:hypothetical protein n=1 Tax=Dyella sp. C11 TaxID=2126991 RepID=UPI000D644864|nr:hypothetical protein [Dyella sp. C11]